MKKAPTDKKVERIFTLNQAKEELEREAQAKQKAINECNEIIVKALKEYDCRLVVDLGSPLNNIQINLICDEKKNV